MMAFIVGALKILAPLSVATIVFAEALGVSPGQVASLFKHRPGLMLRSLLAEIVAVPAAGAAYVAWRPRGLTPASRAAPAS